MTPEFTGRAGRLLLTALLAAAAGAARATEAGPGATPPRGEIAAEIWRLRPAVSTVPASTGPRDTRPAGAIPEARRNVRMVYPALTEAR